MSARIPWPQGKMQGISPKSAFLRKSVPKTSANPDIYGRIPYSTAQGIVFASAGN
jgi:hypothetical protein